jgi:hypothetical protein
LILFGGIFYSSFFLLPISHPQLHLLLCHCLSSRSHLSLRSHLQLPAPFASHHASLSILPSFSLVGCCVCILLRPLTTLLLSSASCCTTASCCLPLIVWWVVAPPPLKPLLPLAGPLLYFSQYYSLLIGISNNIINPKAHHGVVDSLQCTSPWSLLYRHGVTSAPPAARSSMSDCHGTALQPQESQQRSWMEQPSGLNTSVLPVATCAGRPPPPPLPFFTPITWCKQRGPGRNLRPQI